MSKRGDALQKSAEGKERILNVMRAIGRPITGHDLAQHTLLSGMTGPRIGALLRFLRAAGVVKSTRRGWVVIGTKRNVPAARSSISETPTNMFFVLNVTDKTVMLDVGGMRLPVTIES